MGTVASNVLNNDELVDDLLKCECIRTRKVEKVFRAVDRADYFPPFQRAAAYKDIAWKFGNIHLSAPYIYGKVMEALCLEPGLSFLNLGSGTGYLSTMAGLILSQHGTNHGIELHEDCLKYAYKRLEEFKQKSLAFSEFDFCEPLFIQGNCFNVAPGRQYDRVYCGALCPESHEDFIKQFVRVGGILVMPYKDHLLRIHRIDEENWMYFEMSSVLFPTLVVPIASEQTLFHLPECGPLSLQELCRGKIRHRLCQNVWNEHRDLESKRFIVTEPRKLSPLAQPSLKRFIIPIFEESDRAVRFLLTVETQNEHSQVTVVQFNRNDKESINGTTEASNNAHGISSTTDERSQENEMHKQHQAQTNFLNEIITTTGQMAKRQKTDSGIVDINLSNEDGSLNSNTNHSDLETVFEAVGAMDLDLSDITLNTNFLFDSIFSEYEFDSNSNDEVVACYVNIDAFSTYMREKIHQLPLPLALKLYIAYNREL